MCGICGELRFDNRSPDMAVIKRMSEKLARRGPDHAGRDLATGCSGPRLLACGHWLPCRTAATGPPRSQELSARVG